MGEDEERQNLPDWKAVLSRVEKLTLVEALREIQKEIRWKPGKDIIHLTKRQNLRHLHQSATISEYHGIIHEILRNRRNVVYLYVIGGTYYYAVRGFSNDDDNEWIVLFGTGGLMETAFPPENMDEYLSRRGFILLGTIEEVLKWTREAED